jgi:type VI secretion system protein ImpL
VKLFLRMLLAALVWTLVAGGAGLVSLVLMDDLMPGLEAAAGLFFLWYAVVFLRWFIKRQAARRRVEQLVNVAPDDNGLVSGIWRLTQRRSPGEDRFLEVMQFLDATRLGNKADAAYVLPWSLVLGDTAANVGDVLGTTRLRGPTLEHPALNGGDGDVSWRLSNSAMLLQAPPSWCATSNASHQDWLSLLMMLDRHRHAEPVNSVVIAVSMTTLQTATADDLELMARSYRRMLEDIVQVLGMTVPVTLLLTGFETLKGAENWMARLPEPLRLRPFGDFASGQDLQAFGHDLAKRWSSTVSNFNLMALRDGVATPDMLSLPAAVMSVGNALSRLLVAMLGDNPYQESQRLNGVFIAGTSGNATDSPETLFLSELLQGLIPAQRHEYRILDSAERRKAGTRRRRATKAALITVAAAALMTGLQQYDVGVLKTAYDDYLGKVSGSDSLSVVADNLLAYRELIVALGEKRYVPWSGLLPSEPDVLGKMRDDLANRVDARIVSEIDRLFLDRLESGFFRDPVRDVDKAAEYASVLIRQINVLEALKQGAAEQSLREMPQPFDTQTFAGNAPDQLAALNDLYITALVWSRGENPEAANTHADKKLQVLRERLARILATAGVDLAWLIEWANQSTRLKPYKVSDYWREGSGDIRKDVIVPRAFTLAGKQQIDAFVEELKAANLDARVIDDALPRFRQQYKARYLKAWEDFALGFAGGLDALESREEWLTVINQLNTRRNHFFSALALIDNETEPFRKDDDLPQWLVLLGVYQDMRALSASPVPDDSKRNQVLTSLALKTVGKFGEVGKMLATGTTSALKNKDKIDKASPGPTPDERARNLEEAAALLDEYNKALGEFVYTSEIRSSSFAAVSALFNDPENPAKGGSPYASAFGAIQKMQGLIGKENAGNAAFWRLLKGPLTAIREYMLQESSCQLDSLWRNTVLAELEGVPDYKRDEYLRGESGILWNFLTTTGKPFFAQELGRGYSVRRIEGSYLSVSPKFLTFVAKSRDAKKAAGVVDVEIRAFPTSLNLDARASVRKTTLSISCVDGTHELNNFNYPVSSSFGWSPSCNSAILDIDLGVLSLQKKWSGPRAFAEVIREFTLGPRNFRVQDFPRQADQLRQLGIDEIRVQYDVDGAEDVLKSVALSPMQVPDSAASCWAF